MLKAPFGASSHPQHVVDADVRDHRPEELRVLREHRAHEEPAVAAALDGEPPGARVPGRHQVLGAGDEVVEHVLLLRRLPGVVPGLAELAAAAQVGVGEDAAVVEPEPQAAGRTPGVSLMP